jgi:L-lactate dehydrogenase complex protein LldG
VSDARARILARIAAGLGRPCPDRLVRPEPPSAPMARAVHDPVADFSARAAALQTSIAQVAGVAGIPLALADWLRASGLPMRGVVWPQWQDLDWAEQGIHLEARPPDSADRLGVTGCFCAIAETGTVLLHSGAGRSASASLLPETHVAIVPLSRLVSRMEQAFALLRRETGTVPRALNFVSGPSRTADIEQTIVIGAHGPRRVHLILVDDAAPGAAALSDQSL